MFNSYNSFVPLFQRCNVYARISKAAGMLPAEKGTKMKRSISRIFALVLILILATGLFAGCSKKPEERSSRKGTPAVTKPADITPTKEPTPSEATPTAEPTAEVTPTAEPTPTEEPTPIATPTEEPTPIATPTEEPATPTPEPTAVPITFGDKMDDYLGTWYAVTIAGLESEEEKCADTPGTDYRLFISEDYLVRVFTETQNLNDPSGKWDDFDLRTSFSDSEKALYESWGYGVSAYVDTPTDFAKGHLVFSCAGHYDGIDNALFIIDAQPDGTIKTEYVCVLDNGSFPVFVEATYSREPVYEMGHYYEDYIGVWNLHSTAAYYCDALVVSDEDPCDSRLIIHDNNTLDYVTLNEKHEIIDVSHFAVRSWFSEDEIKKYQAWDEAGFRTYDSVESGWAATLAQNPIDGTYGGFLFACTDEDDNGTLIQIFLMESSERENTYYIAMDAFSYDSASNREYATYSTFYRDSPYSYAQGSYYADFLGTWQITELRYDGDTEVTVVKDPTAVVELQINPDMTASLLYRDSPAKLELRIGAHSGDPLWYYDIEGNMDLVTDYAKHRLVFICVDPNTMTDGLIVLDRNDDGTLTSTWYFQVVSDVKNIPYVHYARKSGLLRTAE